MVARQPPLQTGVREHFFSDSMTIVQKAILFPDGTRFPVQSIQALPWIETTIDPNPIGHLTNYWVIPHISLISISKID